jgi:hypothetical protein
MTKAASPVKKHRLFEGFSRCRATIGAASQTAMSKTM